MLERAWKDGPFFSFLLFNVVLVVWSGEASMTRFSSYVPLVLAETLTLRGRCVIEWFPLVGFEREIGAFRVDVLTKRPLCEIIIASNWVGRRSRVLYGWENTSKFASKASYDGRSFDRFTHVGLLAQIPRLKKIKPLTAHVVAQGLIGRIGSLADGG